MIVGRGKKSSDEFANDLTAELAELLVATSVEEGELVVVQPEQMKEGGVQVANRVGDLDCLRSQFVRGSHDTAPALPRHPPS